MNELIKLNEYLKENETADTYSEFTEEELKNLIFNMIPFEEPDILSIQEDKIIGIEHFEFDSYQNTNKHGSNYKFQDAEIERKMENEIKENLVKEKELVFHDEYKNSSSLKNYINNFLKVFSKHYSKLNNYEKNIKQKYGTDKSIDFWFFIEDVSPLGSYFYKKENISPTPLLPIFLPEIIDILKQKKKIKGIIFGVSVGGKNKLFLYKNNDETIKFLETKQFNITEEDFISLDTKSIGFAIYIPKEEIESGDNQ